MCFNPPGDVWRKTTIVALPQCGDDPITAGYVFATIGRTTITIKFIFWADTETKYRSLIYLNKSVVEIIREK
jgi:hypothetical protein